MAEVSAAEDATHVVRFNLNDDGSDSNADMHYPDNVYVTAKYTWYTFLPLNLYEQFRRVANTYFVAIVALMFIPGVSPFPVWTTMAPLVFILSIAAIKEWLEDRARQHKDAEMNGLPVQRVDRKSRSLEKTTHGELRVGDLVCIEENEEIPADVVLLYTSKKDGSCSIGKRDRKRYEASHSFMNLDSQIMRNSPAPPPTDTANLDGEAALKVRRARGPIRKMARKDAALAIDLQGLIEASPSSIHFDDFDALLVMTNFKEEGEFEDLFCHEQSLGSGAMSEDELPLPSEAENAEAAATGRPYSRSVAAHVDGVSGSDRRLSRQTASSRAGAKAVVPIGPKNLLLRGSRLRATKWVVAVVVYAGSITKLALNQHAAPFKFSRVETRLNLYIAGIFVFQTVLSVLVSVIARWQDVLWDGLGWEHHPIAGSSTAGRVFFDTITWFILLCYMIPISLYVGLECAKFLQGLYIHWDHFMTVKSLPSGLRIDLSHVADQEQGRPANGGGIDNSEPVVFGEVANAEANSTAIIEELGQIDFLISDKTGTLTENEMHFMCASISGKRWRIDDNGNLIEDNSEQRDARNLCNNSKVVEFIKLMCICNTLTAQVSSETNQMSYSGESPDEVALAEAAQQQGIELLERLNHQVRIQYKRNVWGKVAQDNAQGAAVQCFDVLANLEFTSSRKRMSMVVRLKSSGVQQHPAASVVGSAAGGDIGSRDSGVKPAPIRSDSTASEGQILIITKGADSAVLPRIKLAESKEEKQLLKHTEHDLQHYSEMGLRTLVFAVKLMTEQEYEDWLPVYEEAISAIKGRERQVEEAFKHIENNLTLLGCSAVEDKLQSGVPETLIALKAAGIQVAIATGDKIETAVNIGHNCGLLRDTEVLFHTTKNFSSSTECAENLKLKLDVIQEGKKEGAKFSAIFDGPTVSICLENKEILPDFLNFFASCKAVVFCSESLYTARCGCASYADYILPKPITIGMTPSQKADIVGMVKAEFGKTVLSIGDGANDVSMILAAHVGVGLRGKEGSQAANNADFSLSRFWHLRRLILVHGRYAFIRNLYQIKMQLFSNMAFNLPQLFFGVISGFTGTSLQAPTILSLFNPCFMILAYASQGFFEADIDERTAMTVPYLYATLRSGSQQNDEGRKPADGIHKSSGPPGGFGIAEFAFELLFSVWYASVSFTIAYVTHLQQITDSTGHSPGLISAGVLCTSILIPAVQLDAGLRFHRWTLGNHLAVWLAIVVYFMTLFVYPYVWSPTSTLIYSVDVETFTQQGWLTVLLGVVVSVLPRFTFLYAQRAYFPRASQIYQEKGLGLGD